MQHLLETGRGYEKDDFVVDDEDTIEYDDDVSSDLEPEDKEESMYSSLSSKRIAAAKLGEDEICISDAESVSWSSKRAASAAELDDEELLNSFVMSANRKRISFTDMLELHVAYAIKRILYPRIDAVLCDNTSHEFKNMQLEYADRFHAQLRACMENIAKSCAWKKGVLEKIQEMPFIQKTKKEHLIEPLDPDLVCEACGREKRNVSCRLTLWGVKCADGTPVQNANAQIAKKYDDMDGDHDEDDIAIKERHVIYVGRFCAKRIRLFHNLAHLDTLLHLRLLKHLQELKEDHQEDHVRFLRHGKCIYVMPTPETFESEFTDEYRTETAEIWFDKVKSVIQDCADFAKGGRFVWKKKKKNGGEEDIDDGYKRKAPRRERTRRYDNRPFWKFDDGLPSKSDRNRSRRYSFNDRDDKDLSDFDYEESFY